MRVLARPGRAHRRARPRRARPARPRPARPVRPELRAPGRRRAARAHRLAGPLRPDPRPARRRPGSGCEGTLQAAETDSADPRGHRGPHLRLRAAADRRRRQRPRPPCSPSGASCTSASTATTCACARPELVVSYVQAGPLACAEDSRTTSARCWPADGQGGRPGRHRPVRHGRHDGPVRVAGHRARSRRGAGSARPRRPVRAGRARSAAPLEGAVAGVGQCSWSVRGSSVVGRRSSAAPAWAPNSRSRRTAPQPAAQVARAAGDVADQLHQRVLAELFTSFA